MDDRLVELDLRPAHGVEIQLEAVRRGGLVHGRDVLDGSPVLEEQQAAGLVRRLGAGMGRDRVAHRRRDYHQSVRSIEPPTSSALQKSALRYFQPPSARMQTTTAPSSSSSASFRATCTTAPPEMPAKIPSRSRRARTAATDSSFDTSTFRSSFDTSRIGGT